MSEARDIQRAMTTRYKAIEADLDEDEEIIFTFFQPTREVRLRVGRVGLSDARLIVISGLDPDENTVELFMYYQHLNYMLEVKKMKSEHKYGFITEFEIS